MTDHRAPGARRLAFFYHPSSFSVFALAEAAREVCQLVWVVDREIEDTATMLPMLARLGTVVEVTGLDPDAAAAAIAAQQPDGILTLKDALMQRTAELAQRLSLPFHSPLTARRFTDKHLQRMALRDGGLPTPGFWQVPVAVEDPAWDAFAAQARFPAILKPRHNSEGSRDTMRVDGLQAVAEALTDESDDGQSLVLEEYLGDRSDGSRAGFADYVSVETIVSDGVISHLAVTGRFPPAPPFRESGFFIDAALTESDRHAALATASAAVAAMGVEIGCLHTEIKFTPDGPRVIELNGRIGGGVPEMLEEATGVVLLPIALRIALGETASFPALPATEHVAYLLYVQAPSWMRMVTSVEGLDALAAEPEVTEILLNRGPGQMVDWREGNHGHVYSVRGAVADHDALLAFEARVHREVRIDGVGEADPAQDVGTVALPEAG